MLSAAKGLQHRGPVTLLKLPGTETLPLKARRAGPGGNGRKGSAPTTHPNGSRLSSSTEAAFVTAASCPGTSARDPGSPRD